jgi:hypothetical protein
MTEFQYKLKLILAGQFEFTKQEREELFRLWSIENTEDIDSPSTNSRYNAQKRYYDKKKDDEEFRKKQKEYMARYYREKRCGGKPPRERTTSVELRERVKKFNSKLCIYEGEEIKYGTLVSRLHNKKGMSFHDANIEAKKYLKEQNND